MAAPVCQFVDRVGTGAQQRLNLNDGDNLTLLLGPDFPGPDFTPPRLKRAVVNTLLAEGASIPASAYDNRIIRLPLRITACDEEEMAATLESLHRELDREFNVLKWQPTYNHPPVYFRTFRSPDYRLDQARESGADLRADLAILAEPFALGDYIQQSGTIYNDPAAVANGIHFEIAAVEGDVPTPLFFYISTVLSDQLLFGSRRHGTPALYVQQAEGMTQGVDTTVQANDPAMSGPGQNWSQTTFATATMQTRLTWMNVPGAGDDENYRGTYRVFARVGLTVGTDTIDVRMLVGLLGLITSDTVRVPNHPPPGVMLDLGLVQIPPASDPIYDGYSRVILPAENTRLVFQAERVAGTGSLNWDYVVLVPADEELLFATFGTGYAHNTIDGPNDKTYHGDLATVLDRGATPQVGSIPLVTPDQTNLYVAIRGIGTNDITDTMAYIARYWPRYIYIR